MEIVKGFIYAALGMMIGMVLMFPMETVAKVLCIVALAVLLGLAFLMNVIGARKKEEAAYNRNQIRTSGSGSQIRTSQGNGQQAAAGGARVSRSTAPVQESPLDRRPMSAEKKERHEQSKVPAKKIVLLNEEGQTLLEWSLQNKTSLIIGKSSEKEPVDIDLSGSAVAQMISKQHAVLNYTDNGWYVDDIDSKNGTRVKKATQNAIMDVKLVGAIEVEVGDIIYIANTLLQIQ